MEKILFLDEAQMIAGLKSRNQHVFGQMYEKYSQAFFGFICKLVNNNDIAHDVLQDVFVNIWKNIDQYDAAKGRFYTWAINIVRNTTINFLRSKYYNASTKIQNLDDYVNNDWLSVSSGNEDYIGMDRIVSGMDDKYKVVIHLIYYLGYSQQEAADKLNIPLGTVKSRTRSGLQQLKVLLEH